MEVVKERNSIIIRKPNVNSPKSSTAQLEEEDMGDLRRGPWTVEEDFKLIRYIASHGEGRWNYLARCAGLKRTGKSCRLRWLNYLRPDLRRGNITLQEQLTILQLHSRWGNRWSKIAQHLPGRTDNEIKNYWRTRVQKHAKQLKCDVNSKQFKDAVRYVWIPRLMERIQAAANASSSSTATTTTTSNYTATLNSANYPSCSGNNTAINNIGVVCGNLTMTPQGFIGKDFGVNSSYTSDNSSTAASLDSFGTHVSPISDLTTNIAMNESHDPDYFQASQVGYSDSITNSAGYFNQGFEHFQVTDQNNQLLDDSYNFWNVEDLWFLQQLNNGMCSGEENKWHFE